MRRPWALGLPFATLLAGCATYRPHPLDDQSVARALAVPSGAVLAREARDLRHPLLPAIDLDPAKPLTPEGAAVLAVLVNPDLRAQRDRIGVSSAQVIQAGLLPNPQITPNGGVVTGGPGTTNPFGIGVSWDITALITRGATRRAAELSLQSVRLDVAWAEWRTAEAAKSAAYAVVALERELDEARAAEVQLRRNLAVVQAAYDRHQQTVMQLSAASASAASVRDTMLSLEQKLAAERLKLAKALGLPAEATVRLSRDVALPCVLQPPPEQTLMQGLQARRLDLAGLRRGYESQEQTVRAAILGQFPNINLAVDRARDNSDVRTIDATATITLPVFDRNQGAIALQRATRQKLFDEYVARLHAARADIATLRADISALDRRISSQQASIATLAKLAETYHRAALLGLADIINYYDAVDKLTTARLALLGLQGSLANDWVSLELASADPLPPPMGCRQSKPAGRS